MPLGVLQSGMFWGWFTDSSTHCRLYSCGSGQGMLEMVWAACPTKWLVLSSLLWVAAGSPGKHQLSSENWMQQELALGQIT